MKVFISWSGERSKSLAEALRDWIPLVLHYVEPWLSEADIEAGARWAEAVAKELETSNFGIICVNRENVASPWVLFEAGALAKSMVGSKVIPLLLDLDFRDITGPLAQFQAKKVDKSGLSEVIHSINQSTDNAVPEERAKQLFDALWPEFEKRVASIPKQPSATKHSRPQHEILEELVASIRSLDSRFREISPDFPFSGRLRKMRMHPFMIRDLAHMISEKSNDPIALLMVSSMFREEMPWLYELGMEAYHAAKSGSPEEAALSRRRFLRASELLMKGPFPIEETGVDPRMIHMLIRDLEHLLSCEPQEKDNSKNKSKRKKEKQQE